MELQVLCQDNKSLQANWRSQKETEKYLENSSKLFIKSLEEFELIK